ncbi:P-loop containing nucleoside triphosphate hydrolase protein [Gautieria morchelliformis]|nr:P-loop containing nucleoside triphosphate hydrolase protein [Gautieria morchelliformis]
MDELPRDPRLGAPSPARQQPRVAAGRFSVVECPSSALALSNCIIVHPSNFPTGMHVILNSQFPLTTRHDNTGKLAPGQIGASSSQRQWMGLSIAGDEVTLAPLDLPPAEIYLDSLDLEVGFWKRGLEIAEQFSADEMTQSFIRAFSGQIFALDQQLVFDFHGQNLKASVKGLNILELAEGQNKRRGGSGISQMGVLMERTDVVFIKAADSRIKIKSSDKKAPSNAILAPNFKFEDMGIGGLDSEFSVIFRRAFASRVFPPGLVDKLGIQHVKGILLFGPPGTGKTLMARQIGKMLNAREPKIVNGPEILNKFVGASEENIRKLFADAEKEYKQKGDESGLHIIIFDELDAICKQRGSGAGGGTGVGDSVVNQLLSKMDGVDQLNNILLIGMTNRLDMIDEALLRPGRLEVHMEISLPDEHGRHQILNIHTAKMRTNKVMDSDVDLAELATLTKNFSGAEIGGLVKSATSFAFNRHVKVGTMAGISDDIDKLRVNRDDFMQAFSEVQPAFGVSEEELQTVVQNGIYHFHDNIRSILEDGALFVEQVRSSIRTPRVSLLLHGPPGSGKTALAATIAKASEFPFIKLISPDSMVGFSESQQVAAISKIFADSYKSPLSVIVLDNIERLLGWVPVGPRFSNAVLQALLVLLQRTPPKGRRLLIIATTSIRGMLTDLQMSEVFDADTHVPPITTLRSVKKVLREVNLFTREEELSHAMGKLRQAGFGDDEYETGLQIGIKKLLSVIEMARQEPEEVAERLVRALVGLKM